MQLRPSWGGTKGSRVSAKEFLPPWVPPAFHRFLGLQVETKMHGNCKHIPQLTPVPRRSPFNRKVN